MTRTGETRSPGYRPKTWISGCPGSGDGSPTPFPYGTHDQAKLTPKPSQPRTAFRPARATRYTRRRSSATSKASIRASSLSLRATCVSVRARAGLMTRQYAFQQHHGVRHATSSHPRGDWPVSQTPPSRLVGRRKTDPSRLHAKLVSPGTGRVREQVRREREPLDRVRKWTGMVIVCLLDGPRRFTELRRMMEPVTPKVLTQSLQDMERDGLVVRRSLPARGARRTSTRFSPRAVSTTPWRGPTPDRAAEPHGNPPRCASFESSRGAWSRSTLISSATLALDQSSSGR
jgi:hypothetical protein